MTIEQGEVYRAMATAYRQGVLDKSIALFGEATARAMDETGANMGDLINRLDEAEEDTIRKFDGFLARSGPLLRVTSNDRFMGFVSRILDVRFIRNLAVGALAKSIVKSMRDNATPPSTRGEMIYHSEATGGHSDGRGGEG